MRHAVYLGLREDKAAAEVVREPADPDAERKTVRPRPGDAQAAGDACRPGDRSQPPAPRSSKIVTARAPQRRGVTVGGVALTHPDRELWPGITKQDLAEYWQAIADHALAGTWRNVRWRSCAVRKGSAASTSFRSTAMAACRRRYARARLMGQPYLAIDDADGLIAMAQMSAIELHAWGATEADPLHPDQIVFDLDPGDGVAFADVVQGGASMCAINCSALGLPIVLPDHRRQGPARRGAARAGGALGRGEAVLPGVR